MMVNLSHYIRSNQRAIELNDLQNSKCLGFLLTSLYLWFNSKEILNHANGDFLPINGIFFVEFRKLGSSKIQFIKINSWKIY